MRVLSHRQKVDAINGLCNGMSLRSCTRVFGTHRTAIQRLLVRVGENCDRIMADTMRSLDLGHLQIDELWTFVKKKERQLKNDELGSPWLGDQYLFFAIDEDTKEIPAWALGKRTSDTAMRFLSRLQATLNGCKPHVSSDAWAGYPDCIDRVFGLDVDYAVCIKSYDTEWAGRGRYAPPRVSSVDKEIIFGDPDRIGTSHVERANLTVRTFQKRFSRLALGFSKKWENLAASVALFMAYYNLCWQPRTLGGITPAMACGATDRLWEISDLVEGC